MDNVLQQHYGQAVNQTCFATELGRGRLRKASERRKVRDKIEW